MALSEQRKGELYKFANVLIWPLFPVTSVLALRTVPPIYALAWGTLFATVFFLALIAIRNRWHELFMKEVWMCGMYAAIFIGMLYYGFYTWGLQYTSAGNAGILVQFEVFTTFLFFQILRKERISGKYTAGVLLMVVGALVILGRNFSGINVGDLFIILATLFPPLGNYYQRRSREIASAETLMFLRYLISVPFLFLLAYILEGAPVMSGVREALPYLLINGVLLFGVCKIFWIEAIHRIPVTKAIALGALTPLTTLLFAALFLKEFPSAPQLISLPFFIVGVLFLTDALTFRRALK